MVRVTAPFPSVVIGLIEGGVSVMIEAGASSVIMIKVVIGLVGTFSSSIIRETGDMYHIVVTIRNGDRGDRCWCGGGHCRYSGGGDHQVWCGEG